MLTRSLFVALVVVLFVSVVQAGTPGDSGGKLVEYFLPSCPHCVRLEPEMKNLLGQKDLSFSVEQIDANKVDDSQLKAQGIDGFPTVLYYCKGSDKPKEVQGRTASAIKEEVKNLC